LERLRLCPRRSHLLPERKEGLLTLPNGHNAVALFPEERRLCDQRCTDINRKGGGDTVLDTVLRMGGVQSSDLPDRVGRRRGDSKKPRSLKGPWK